MWTHFLLKLSENSRELGRIQVKQCFMNQSKVQRICIKTKNVTLTDHSSFINFEDSSKDEDTQKVKE